MKKFLVRGLLFCSLLILITLGMLYMSFRLVPDNTYLLAQFDKMAKIDDPNRPASIILLGGSNVAFGFDSEMLQDSLHIPVINAAVHAGLGIQFIANDCLPRLREGDILVYSPETPSFYSDGGFYGNMSMSEMFFLRGMTMPRLHDVNKWKIVENIPWNMYKNFISIASSTKEKIGLKAKNPDVYQRNHFNEYGDLNWHWTNDSLQHYSGTSAASQKRLTLNRNFCDYIIADLKDAEQRGVKVVMFPPAAARDNFKGSEYKFSEVAAYMGEHGFSYPDTTGVDFMDYDCTYNTEYHMNKKGAQLHTQHLIEYLRSGKMSSGR